MSWRFWRRGRPSPADLLWRHWRVRQSWTAAVCASWRVAQDLSRFSQKIPELCRIFWFAVREASSLPWAQ